MHKRTLTILLTALLFLSAAVLGVTSVFRVDSVSVQVTAISAEGERYADELQGKLSTLYKHDSTFFTKESKAKKLLAEYPYLQLSEFKKSYPSKLFFVFVEDEEGYAVAKGDGGYYILGKSGGVLDERAELSDGNLQNVLVKGVFPTGVKNGKLTGDGTLESLLALCQAFDKALGEIRENIRSIEETQIEREKAYLLHTREGVELRVYNPTELVEKKAKAVVEKYLSLTDEQRSSGYIEVRDGGEEVFALYKN